MGAARRLRIAEAPPQPSIDGLRDLQPHDRVGIVGKTGTGKGQLVKRAVRELWLQDGRPVIAWDPMDEHSLHGRRTEFRSLGLLPEKGAAIDVDEDLLSRVAGFAVVPSGRTGAELAEEFADLAAALEESDAIQDRGGAILIIEEIGRLTRHGGERLEDVFCRFRHFGIAVIAIAQRQVQIPATCRAQLNHLISFGQSRKADLDALRDEQGETFADGVKRLPRGEFLHWREDEESTDPC